MRITTELFVAAYLRQLSVTGVPAVVARHGDDRGGAILVRIDRLDGTVDLYAPAPAGFDIVASERKWIRIASHMDTLAAEELVAKQISFDSDLWIVDVEDREGRHYLGDAVIERT